jgi:hypothetical protein
MFDVRVKGNNFDVTRVVFELEALPERRDANHPRQGAP